MESIECEEHKNSICRVCLKCDPTIRKNGASIYHKTSDDFIYEKLNSIANVAIKPEDGLPDRICAECLLELHNAIQFKHKCETSNNVLLASVDTNSESSTKEAALADFKLKDEYFTDHEYLEEEPHTSPDIHMKAESGDKHLQSEEESKQPGHQTNKEITSKAVDLKLECHDCGGSFRTKCKLKVHWKKEHLKEYLTCDKCKKVCSSFKALHHHKRKYSKLCTNVQNIFRIKGTGKLIKFYCKQCEYSTSKRSLVKNHVRKHIGEKNYQCDLCPMSYLQISGLQAHKESKHKIYLREGPCNICGQYIQGLYSLNYHMRRKHKKKNDIEVICEICHKVYKNKHYLKEHMKIHFEKKYTCDVCSKKFATSSYLGIHKKNVHEKNSVHICPKCGYKHFKPEHIKSHISKHNEDNCACIVCGRFFENDLQLSLHKQRHNDRNNKCSECGKTFFRRKCLIQHLNTVHKIYLLHSKNNDPT